MTDDPIDFAPFGGPADDLIGHVHARCAPVLATRRRNRAVIQIASWRWPMLAAALAIAAASAFVLVQTPAVSPASTPAVPVPSQGILARRAPMTQLATSLGVPPALASRLTRQRPPALDELVPEVGR